jgi:hypothetical protein
MDAVLSRLDAQGAFKTFRSNQRPYEFRGFFPDNESAGYRKNTFCVMSSAFSDDRGVSHPPGTVYFNGPDSGIRYNIDIAEFFDRFQVASTNLARRKEETRRAVRVTEAVLAAIASAERGRPSDAPADGVVVRVPWDGSDKKVKLGDYIVSHRAKTDGGAVQQQYVPVDKDVFAAIYIEADRNIRAARRLKQRPPRSAADGDAGSQAPGRGPNA